VGAWRSTVDPRRETRSIDRQSVFWEKFLFITGVGGVTALARSGIGPLLASAEGQRLLTASCAEVEAVARAEGIQLGSDEVDRISSKRRASRRSGSRPWRGTLRWGVASRSRR
jgi:ketopantoate reductase